MTKGFTLIEVVLFVGIFGLVVAVMLPLLFSSTEARLRQQTAALVEDNGTQILQQLSRRVRVSERILDPVVGRTGAVLALQSESGTLHPTIAGVQTGVLVIIEGDRKLSITSDRVAVKNFVVRNTSTANAPSIYVSFDVSRTIRLQASHTYDRTFEALLTRYPDHDLVGNPCNCTVAGCSGNRFTWQICVSGSCQNRSDQFQCP